MKTEYNIGTKYINIKSTSNVKLNEEFIVYTEEGPITLDVEINADFNSIPERYHEIFLNVLTAKYMNKVSFGDNPFSECRPVTKRKWYEFWKPKYIEQ